MIELYTGKCRTFLSNYNGPAFDAVITDPPYSSGGATLSERAVSTAEKYTNTKRNCPFPDFAGDQMDARSWLHCSRSGRVCRRQRTAPWQMYSRMRAFAVTTALFWWRSAIGTEACRRRWRKQAGGTSGIARSACATMHVSRRQMPLLSDAVQWAGWMWRGTIVWDKLSSRPQRGRFRQQAEFAIWASNGKLPIDRPVPVLPGVFQQANVQGVKRLHQTQKPLELMRSICKICIPGTEACRAQ